MNDEQERAAIAWLDKKGIKKDCHECGAERRVSRGFLVVYEEGSRSTGARSVLLGCSECGSMTLFSAQVMGL